MLHLIHDARLDHAQSYTDPRFQYLLPFTGACEGSVACSTCHVILPQAHYDMLPEPEDDENDMLDMAFGLTDTSRLGCQVKLIKELGGVTCTLPAATRNMFVDGECRSFSDSKPSAEFFRRSTTDSSSLQVTSRHIIKYSSVAHNLIPHLLYLMATSGGKCYDSR